MIGLPASLGAVPPAGGGGGGGSLFDAITALSPDLYFRLRETSGPTMVAEAGGDGGYSGTPSFSQGPLYPGGPDSTLMASGYGTRTQSGASPSNNVGIFSVIKFNDLSGQHPIIMRDGNSGGGSRIFQWRTNGTALELIKILGGVELVSSVSGVVNTTDVITIGLRVVGTQVEQIVNGTVVYSGAITAFNFWADGDSWDIGFSAGMGGIYTNGIFSEAAMWRSPPSAAEFAALHAASGL